MTAAERVLSDLGFDPVVDEAEMPTWWREHSLTWLRELDGQSRPPPDLVGWAWTRPALADPLEVRRAVEVGGLPARTLTVPPGRSICASRRAAWRRVGSPAS